MVGVTLAAFGGCGDTEGGDGNTSGYCDRLSARLSDCGMGALISEQGSSCDEPKDEEERCMADCFFSESCEDLRELVCADEFDVAELAVLECFEACEPPPFRCGSGEDVEDDVRCDGYADCSDGSDEEADCPTCGNGESYAEWARCDGYSDCSDGADEKGCPMFRCANDESVPEDAECDFYTDCSDGSDEHGACPDGFQCESGEVIRAEWRCDDIGDCADDSDEPSTCPPSAEEQICGD